MFGYNILEIIAVSTYVYVYTCVHVNLCRIVAVFVNILCVREIGYRSCYCIIPLTNSLLHFAEEVEIFLDQTAYSIFENETIVTVTLSLSDDYRQDIAVTVAVGELAGGYREL